MADIFGTRDADYLYGEAENDYIDAGRGGDVVYADPTDSYYDDWNGTYTYSLYGYDDEVYGSTGSDYLIGDNNMYSYGYTSFDGGEDIIAAGTGRDRVIGDGELYTYEDEYVSYYAGNDDMSGGRSDDTLIGDGSISAYYGDGEFYAEAGDDRIVGGTGDDEMWGDFEYVEGVFTGVDEEDALEGDDTFIFYAGEFGRSDIDTIMDFDGGDTFEIYGLSWRRLDSNRNGYLDDGDRSVEVDYEDEVIIDLGRAGGEDRGEDVVTVYLTDSTDYVLTREYFEFL